MKTIPPGRRNPDASTHRPTSLAAAQHRWRSAAAWLALTLVGLLGTARADLLFNGTFTGSNDPWYLVVVTGGSATLQNTNGMARINLSNGGAYRAAVQLHQGVFADLIAGTPYTLSFTATADAPKSVDAIVYSSNGTALGTGYNMVVGTSPTSYAFTFTPTTNETGADLELRIGGNNTGISFDKVSLVADARLTWAPPTLVNPTVEVPGTGGSLMSPLDDEKDYIIKLPANVRTTKVAIIGGRNVVLIGGTIDNDKGSTAIDIQDGKGTHVGRIVHIEGVLITNSTGKSYDGIDVECPHSIVQIENVRIEKLTGAGGALHADVLQTFGGSQEIRVDRLTGDSNYQGFFLPGNVVNKNFIFKNVNLLMDPPLNADAKGGFAFWLDQGQNTGTAAVPTSLQNIYIEPRSGRTLVSSVAPDTKTTPSYSPMETDGYLTWNGLSFVTGGIYDGLPPDDNDFVPAAAVGLNYTSPGYLQASAWEAESIAAFTSSDSAATVTETGYSQGAARQLAAGAVNDYVNFTVPNVPAGTYTVKVGVKKSAAFGQFQLAIDGVNQGTTQDEYSANAAYTELTLGTKTFATSADHQFKFTVPGKNAGSSGYALTFDYIKLQP